MSGWGEDLPPLGVEEDLPLWGLTIDRITFSKAPPWGTTESVWIVRIENFNLPSIFLREMFRRAKAHIFISSLTGEEQLFSCEYELPLSDIWLEDGKLYIKYSEKKKGVTREVEIYDIKVPSGLTGKKAEIMLIEAFSESKAVVEK